MLSELLTSQFDLATHIFSFLDSFTLLSCLEISSSFYAAATQKNVWKDRWLWRTNAHPDSGNLTYQQFRGIRNIEVEFLNQTYVSFKENSSQCPDDQVLESMSLLQLECLISFCEHSEVYHDSLSEFDRNSDLSHQNSQRFLGHLGFSDHLRATTFDDPQFIKLIHHRHATITFFASQKRWDNFIQQILNPLLPSFHKDLSCLVMEGLIQISELQHFGCDCEVINIFVRSITERSWHRFGEMFQDLELLQHSHPRSYFPRVGWSLQNDLSLREVSQSEQQSFQRKRQIVSSLDRSHV
jgi:hypothetical protein